MTDAVKDLIQNALDQDYNKANKVFGDIMGLKVQDILDQEKIRIADQMYNDAPEEEQLELDLEDEPIEDDVDELEDDVDEVTDEDVTETPDEESEE